MTKQETKGHCIVAMQGLDRTMVRSSRLAAILHTQCEICMDTLCEFCTMETVRKPHARVKNMVSGPVVSAESNHWAMILVKKLERKQNWMLDIYQILDVHAKGKVQWRRKDLSIKDMEKRSYGAHDYVMDSFPYHRYELEQEQKRETHRIEDKKPTEISWSCKSFNPKELVPYWPDFKEEHV